MTATKDSIIQVPNANLRQRSKKISAINKAVLGAIKDMEEATLDWESSRQHEVGVALAAVQIDKLLRLVIIRENPDNKEDKKFSVFMNPEITKQEGPVKSDFEGCLSVPDIYGKVPRYSKVRIKATDVNGKIIRLKAEGFLARVFQHEIDHLNGKVFIDHIKNRRHAFYKLLPDGKLKQLDYDKTIKNNRILWQ